MHSPLLQELDGDLGLEGQGEHSSKGSREGQSGEGEMVHLLLPSVHRRNEKVIS